MHSVYFLKSLKNGKLYSGMTGKDPEERLKEHNSKSNEWTSRNGPFKLVYYETYLCKGDALRREAFYKSGIGRRIRKAILKELGA